MTLACGVGVDVVARRLPAPLDPAGDYSTPG